MSLLFVHFVLSLYKCSLAGLCFFQEHKRFWYNLLFHCVSVSPFHILGLLFCLNSSHFCLVLFFFKQHPQHLSCIRNASLVSFIARLLFLISTMFKKKTQTNTQILVSNYSLICSSVFLYPYLADFFPLICASQINYEYDRRLSQFLPSFLV